MIWLAMGKSRAGEVQKLAKGGSAQHGTTAGFDRREGGELRLGLSL